MTDQGVPIHLEMDWDLVSLFPSELEASPRLESGPAVVRERPLHARAGRRRGLARAARPREQPERWLVPRRARSGGVAQDRELQTAGQASRGQTESRTGGLLADLLSLGRLQKNMF